VYYGFVDWQAPEGAPFPDRMPRSGYLYTDAKIDAEELLTDAPPGGPTVAILRAPAIFGPGSREWTVGMMQKARKGRLYLPGGGNFPLPYVYVDNLVDAVVTVLQKDAPGGAFDLLDGRTTYREYAMSLARLAGRSPRSVPFFVVWLAAAVSDALQRLTGRVRPMSRPLVRVMMAKERRHYVTADKARRELGWEPRVDFAEGMRRVEAWLRANGHLA
jgi:nucleoside-diphosphate-sugar epimerase